MSQDQESRREIRLRKVLKRRQPDLTVVMDNIHDPHNVFAIMRTCDAVGIIDIHLVYTFNSFPSEFRKGGKSSSSGVKKWMRLHHHEDEKSCFKHLRERGFRIYASSLEEKARTIYEVDMTQKIALVFGNENQGVSKETAALADGTFFIPMMGLAQSLNVSVAAAISLYEGFRQRLKAGGHYDRQKLSPESFEKIFAQWQKK